MNLLNDPVFVEAAQALAARVLREAPGGFSERLTFAFRTCLARSPSATEIDSLASYFDTQKKIFENDPKAAASLAPFDLNGHDPLDTATWVSTASVLLNLDEFITRE